MMLSSRRARLLALVLGSVLIASLVVPGAAAAPPPGGPTACPDIMPTSEVSAGMLATGYTVAKGRNVEPFDVEVLGVLRDAIAPGRDMIVVDTASPAIAEAGGIWYGMSGSPVYAADGRLLGVLAYGLTWGPSSIAGLTPAQDVAEVLNYPVEDASAMRTASVELSPALNRAVAQETGLSTAASSEMSILKSPLSVSGVSGHRLKRINETLDREGMPLRAYSGSSAPGMTAVLGTAPTAGESFAATLSYGDVTFGGIGTTSYVCQDKGVAFGHPFFWWPAGSVALGASAADAIAIIPETLGGPYKLANVAEVVGVVDQDRYAGIRSLFDRAPNNIPVTSEVSAPQVNRTRTGETDVVDSRWTPFVAFVHVLTNIDSTFDQVGEGSSSATFTINGVRESGEPFSITRSNVYASEWDVAYATIAELDRILYSLFYNDFEDIEFTGVDFDTEVRSDVDMLRIKHFQVSRNGGAWVRAHRREMRVRPGDQLDIRYQLQPLEPGAASAYTHTFVVPEDAGRRGVVTVSGGGTHFYDDEECFFSDECKATGAGSFEGLLDKFQNAPTNDQVLARMMFRDSTQKFTETAGAVVGGRKYLALYVRR